MKNWVPEIFEYTLEGVSTAFEPEALGPNQVAWAKNVVHRGGKPSSRPQFVERLILPDGLHQGIGYFSIQGGLLVCSIAGGLYRINVGNKFEYQTIPLASQNSPAISHVWMCETVGSLVIQDGQSDAVIYDGASARRANAKEKEVPRGRFMAYGNGRLWLALNNNELAAGDVKTKPFQSELKFTETQYLLGGGAFYFEQGLRGMAFIPIAGGTGQGGLLVFTRKKAELVRADITYRDLWPQIPGLITSVLKSTGAISHESIVAVNQDLFWRDNEGGVRSVATSRADESAPGSAPLSNEIRRITDHESQKHLSECSAIYFKNRLIMTASPYLVRGNVVAFRDLITMDCAGMTSMRGKTLPAWEGEWEGLPFKQLVSGEFNGRQRAFVVSSDRSGHNRLWEFVEEGMSDVSTVSAVKTSTPIKSYIEYPRRAFGDVRRRKSLQRADVFISDIEGPVTLTLYWRPDHDSKWLEWDSLAASAKMTDASSAAPHVWKNLRPQYRPQVRSFSIPENYLQQDAQRAAHVGFEFQFRLAWTGKLKIHRFVVYADPTIEQTVQANREEFSPDAIEYNVTGNEIQHVIPT